MKKIKIKDWFLLKNFNTQQYQALKNGYDAKIEKETEKACLLNLSTDFGVITSWIPKSVIEEDNRVKETTFKVGQEVKHNKFGSGIIRFIKGVIIEVDFNGSPKKVLNKYLK